MNGDSPLRQNYERVLARIDRACEAAARPRASVHLLAVSKTFPAADVLALAALGQRAFGENYVQEALDKIAACRDERSRTSEQPLGRPLSWPLFWHFIGPIQSNKTRPIAEHFDWVHSLDREKIARRLAEQRPPELEPLRVCVQVNVSGEASKSGVAPDEALALVQACRELPALQVRGLTAIPEPTDDASLQRRRFAQLRALHERIRATLDPQAAGGFDTLSMGMSADLESAIAEGSTIVRIGTALFGNRPPRTGAG
ncbi:MAG: YggS family pyridoxal phosphate-dependent enzyme [Burkholderiaceae bacterium]|jgi:pyridoxal phosphate enzyme (YggS family)|nr:YggS family pyridoxal phosphate-dependent enzyme [Burkholderiaceae bacterium]